MEIFALLLHFAAVGQKFFIEKLGPIEPYADDTFFSECNNHCWNLSATTLPHYFPYQQLSGNVNYFI